MPRIRLLVRIRNKQYSSKDCTELTRKWRETLKPLQCNVGNLRVSNCAVEFDVFCQRSDISKLKKKLDNLLTLRDITKEPSYDDPFTEALRLYEEERFWEVHESLEQLWKKAEGSEKRLLQGLILIAAANVHLQKNRREAADRIFRRALPLLESDHYRGINISALRRQLSEADHPSIPKLVIDTHQQ
jgi:thioredoxin-like negative regulator of GroEL